MGRLVPIDDGRWIQPDLVVRVTAVNGTRCVIRFVDDHSIEVGRPASVVVEEINQHLAPR